MLPRVYGHKARPVTGESSRTQAEIHARLGAAALQRYVTGPADRAAAEYATAMRELNLALSCLAAGDPMRADVSFDLGATRLAAHSQRCTKPCAATAEFREIVEQIAVGGARPGAPARQLSRYATVLDQLYDHTGDPADIDTAIDWLRRAAADRRLPAAERRRMLVRLAVQHANRGEALRAAQRRSGPGTDSWAAFDTAIRLFDEVLAAGSRRADRRDGDRPADRLDAWLGQLETYYQRGADTARDDDLDRIAAAARSLIGEMTPGYHVRTFALGRAGTALIQRITRLLGEPWDLALNSLVPPGRPDAITAAFGRVPDFGPDLELAIGALGQAVALTDPADRRHQDYTAALFSAHCLRYLAVGAKRDLDEIGRIGLAGVVPDASSLRALAAPGAGSQDVLASTPDATAEAVAALLAQQPPGTARAAARSVLAVARYGIWLRERTGEGLGGSLNDLRLAIAELPSGHPLRARLTLLLVRMLLDRAQLGGDLADGDAALRLLAGLRAQAAVLASPASLPVLLAAAGPPGLSELLAAAPADEAGFPLDLEAAEGTGRLLHGLLTLGMPRLADEAKEGGRADLDAAAVLLRRVADALPAADPRRPDVLSDLGLARLAAGRAATAAEVLREAVAAAAAVPGGHPRQAAILLRAAAARAAAERDAARAAATGEEHAGPRTGAGPHAFDAGSG